MYRAGVLKAVIDRDVEDGIGRIDFTQREVSDFLAKIEILEFLDNATETVDLTVAAKRSGFSMGHILGHVFSGDVMAYRTLDNIDLSVVRISVVACTD